MQLTQIRKRDGRSAPFDASKITGAIAAAARATGEFPAEDAGLLTLRVLSKIEALSGLPALDVETIQDMVENVLFESSRWRTAKAYILYREQRSTARMLAQSGSSELMDSYLEALDWKVKENSNMGYSLQGLNNYIASAVTSNYWLENIYPAAIREAHRNGDIHIHDLNLLSVYCVGWDLMDLLRSGFKGISGNIESAPPKHLHSALGQLVNFFYTLQGEAAGAQAVSSFDTMLAPFVRADGMSYSDVVQAFQEFVFNINIPTRVGFQTPFTNITMDLTPPDAYKKTKVVIGGKDQDSVYGDYGREMDIVNRAFAEVMMAGDSRERVFTFPIPTYNISKGFDWDNPTLDPVWRMAGHYGIPYFSNFVNSDMSPEDARSMCCRLRIDNRLLKRRGGGLFGANPLTGSVGVVTLNLPRLGKLSRDEGDFFGRLDRLLELSRESLTIKRKELERFTGAGLYPYTRFYLRSVAACSGSYWSNHFSTIGVVGANEASVNLFGEGVGTQKGRDFALRVLSHIRARLSDIQEETGDLYNLEATPAEGCSYRLARLDMKLPGMIFANGRSEDWKGPDGGFKPFYTNSTHLPVDHSDDLFEVLEHQDPLQALYTGGTVLHSFLGEEISDVSVVKSLVRKITENFRIPYFTLTPTFSICPEHGYIRGEQGVCPACGAETDVYSRVVGYLRPVNRWNDGKKAEFAMRKAYAGLPDAGAEAEASAAPKASATAFKPSSPGAPDRPADVAGDSFPAGEILLAASGGVAAAAPSGNGKGGAAKGKENGTGEGRRTGKGFDRGLPGAVERGGVQPGV
ncbi:MAG: ribonucleoside triphosphate reductase [Deltaproteobacteria bacterium]|jgi:ribonucleoside-triphosphate reductase|nr:ribonucleoside triphosphate reductase [Deltaproteobacteria bacterium]